MLILLFLFLILCLHVLVLFSRQWTFKQVQQNVKRAALTLTGELLNAFLSFIFAFGTAHGDLQVSSLHQP
jgi:hypothetical protein